MWSSQEKCVESKVNIPRELTEFVYSMEVENFAADWLWSSFCFRWLAKDEDDGLIVRELPLGGTSLLNSTSRFIYSL